MSHRRCSVCNSNNLNKIHHISFSGMEAFQLPKEYDVVECQECGFCYADTLASQRDYDDYYKNCNQYSKSPKSAVDIPNYIWFHEKMKQLYHDHEKDITILDIGFGKGEFIEFLNQKGYQHVIGLDPSKDSVTYMREKGYEVYLGSLFEKSSSIIHQKIDVICLWEVMEHLLDLDTALDILKSYIKIGSYVMVAVPDCSNLSLDSTPIPNNFNQEHINYFSKQSLTNLMQVHSYQKVRLESCRVCLNEKYSTNNLLGIFQYTQNQTMLLKDFTLAKEIKKYIQKSKTKEKKLLQLFSNLQKSQEPIIIWGVGAMVMELWQTSPLKYCNITAYVDNNPLKIGTFFSNIKVIAPTQLYNKNGSIVICSMFHTLDIVEQIQMLKLSHKIYKPFETDWKE